MISQIKFQMNFVTIIHIIFDYDIRDDIPDDNDNDIDDNDDQAMMVFQTIFQKLYCSDDVPDELSQLNKLEVMVIPGILLFKNRSITAKCQMPKMKIVIRNVLVSVNEMLSTLPRSENS